MRSAFAKERYPKMVLRAGRDGIKMVVDWFQISIDNNTNLLSHQATKRLTGDRFVAQVVLCVDTPPFTCSSLRVETRSCLVHDLLLPPSFSLPLKEKNRKKKLTWLTSTISTNTRDVLFTVPTTLSYSPPPLLLHTPRVPLRASSSLLLLLSLGILSLQPLHLLSHLRRPPSLVRSFQSFFWFPTTHLIIATTTTSSASSLSSLTTSSLSTSLTSTTSTTLSTSPIVSTPTTSPITVRFQPRILYFNALRFFLSAFNHPDEHPNSFPDCHQSVGCQFLGLSDSHQFRHVN
jgi:hypothetical protein